MLKYMNYKAWLYLYRLSGRLEGAFYRFDEWVWPRYAKAKRKAGLGAF